MSLVKIKMRIILDTKQSEVKLGTVCMYRSILPRVADAVFGGLEQSRDAGAGEDLEWTIADFTVSWFVSLRACERKYFVGKLRGKYLVFLRTAQGSRVAPATWTAMAGFAT